jgi:GR25 family glycosyltransferase involved in LPS biosynthesis
VKIRRAIIIRHDDPLSRKYAAECAESCSRHGVEFNYLEGCDSSSVDPKSFREKTGRIYRSVTFKEALVAASHAKAWTKIAQGSDNVAVFEHDVLLKRGLDGVETDHLTFLGYRVESRGDYEFPPSSEVTTRRSLGFEGAHAYSLTPGAAEHVLNRMGPTIARPVDEILKESFAISVVDPPVAVAEIGNGRQSTVMSRSMRTNFLPFPGFFRGLLRSAAKKYVIDGGNGWLKF